MIAIAGLVFGALTTVLLTVFALPLSWLIGIVVPFFLINLFWYGFNILASSNLVGLSFANGQVNSNSLTAINGTTFNLNFNFDWNTNLTLKIYSVICLISVFIIIFCVAVAFSRRIFIKYNIGDTNLSPSLEYILYFLLSIIIVPLVFLFMNFLVSLMLLIVTYGVFNTQSLKPISQEQVNQFFVPYVNGIDQTWVSNYTNTLNELLAKAGTDETLRTQINSIISFANGTGNNSGLGFNFLNADVINFLKNNYALRDSNVTSQINEIMSKIINIQQNITQSQSLLNAIVSNYGTDYQISSAGNEAFNSIKNFYNGILGINNQNSANISLNDIVNVNSNQQLFPLTIPIYQVISGNNDSNWRNPFSQNWINIFNIEPWARLSAGIIISTTLLTFMLKFAVNVALRLFMIVGLLVIAPFTIAFGTLDYGYRMRQWFNETVKAFFSLFVIYFVINFFMLLTASIIAPINNYSNNLANDQIWQIGVIIPIVLASLFGTDLFIKYVNDNLTVGRMFKQNHNGSSGSVNKLSGGGTANANNSGANEYKDNSKNFGRGMSKTGSQTIKSIPKIRNDFNKWKSRRAKIRGVSFKK